MNRRDLLKILGVSTALQAGTALALPASAPMVAAAPTVARIVVTCGWRTPLQREALRLVREWEAMLGRPLLWANLQRDPRSDHESIDRRTSAALYQAQVQVATGVYRAMEDRGWARLQMTPSGPFADLANGAELHPMLTRFDAGERVDSASLEMELHYLHPHFSGTPTDLLTMLCGVYGLEGARVSLGRMAWMDGEFRRDS